MDRFEKLSVAAFVLALIAFVAAGNPHIEEDLNRHSEIHKLEIEAPGGTDVVKMAGVWEPNEVSQVTCTDSVTVRRHTSHSVSGVVTNTSGYCYYTENWKTQSEKVVFYGLELFTIDSNKVEADSDIKSGKIDLGGRKVIEPDRELGLYNSEQSSWRMLNQEKYREYSEHRGENR